MSHLPQELPKKVQATYDACITSGQVLYYPSDVTTEENELKTEIRLCESLSKKPGPTPSQLGKRDSADKPAGEKKEKKDVFDPNNWDSLLIDEFDGQMGEEYGLLLNKYAVVPLHFLLVTKHWELQTAPLTPPQLLASYEILQTFASISRSSGSPGGELVCFYNCGTASGASQDHKHVQFAPMEGEGSLGLFPTEKAARSCRLNEQEVRKPFELEILPYAHHIRRLEVPSGADAMATMMYLQEAYLALLDAMLDNLRALPDTPDVRLGKGLSYNLLMTKQHMHIIPRKNPTYPLPHPAQSNGQAEGFEAVATDPTIIGCNALAYTGTVLVKSAQDASKLTEAGGVLKALECCGFPKAERPVTDVNHETAGL